MKITFWGHSAFTIESEGISILVDPFFTDNPMTEISPEEISCDYILVSHGHGDHFGDAIPIAIRNKATIIGVFELTSYCAHQGVKTHPMHIGGSYDFGIMKIKLTQAYHGSSLNEKDKPTEYLGNPCGFLIKIGNKTIYHAGDTGLFGDMKLIGQIDHIDLAMIPIGDNFTMGIDDAVEATKMLQPKAVIPMHYNTWPIIRQDPNVFQEKVLKNISSDVYILNPGDSISI